MALTNLQLVAYCRGQLGRPYWYATYGQIGSEALYKEIARRYPEKVYKWPKSTYVEQYGQRCHDCSGMIKGAVYSGGDPNGVPKYDAAIDLSANGMIDACKEQGSFDTIPEVPGLIVWKPGHVGVFVQTLADGKKLVYEAKGHMYGVCATTDTKWKKWGKLPFIDYGTTPGPTPKPEDKIMLEVKTLRKGDKGPEVYAIQCILKAKGYYTMGLDSSFGSGTQKAVTQYQSDHPDTCGAADGICGKKTWNSLINT